MKVVRGPGSAVAVGAVQPLGPPGQGEAGGQQQEEGKVCGGHPTSATDLLMMLLLLLWKL